MNPYTQIWDPDAQAVIEVESPSEYHKAVLETLDRIAAALERAAGH